MVFQNKNFLSKIFSFFREKIKRKLFTQNKYSKETAFQNILRFARDLQLLKFLLKMLLSMGTNFQNKQHIWNYSTFSVKNKENESINYVLMICMLQISNFLAIQCLWSCWFYLQFYKGRFTEDEFSLVSNKPHLTSGCRTKTVSNT